MAQKVIISLLILFFFPFISEGQSRFECNGDLLISTNNEQATYLYQLKTIPFAPPFLSLFASYSGNFDALGFNFKDNFIYCIEQNTNNVVRLGQNGAVQRLGKVSLVDTLKVESGDCTADGLYVIYDYEIHKVLILNVVDGLQLVKEVDLFWDPKSPNTGPFKARLFDLAFDPNNTKTAYAYQGTFPDLGPSATSGSMLKINLNMDDQDFGMVSPVSTLPSQSISHITGLAFSTYGQLSGFGGVGVNFNPSQDQFVGIDIIQGQVTSVLTHFPKEKMSDACSCPFGLRFTNAVPFEGMFCSNDTKNFVIGLENNSYETYNNVSLKDTLPEGTIIKSISGAFTGNVEAGTGTGTNILAISNLVIPSRSSFNITLEVMSVNAKDGPAFNRAYLTGLPERFPFIIASDDPSSSPPNDRSNFFFTTRGLQKLSWTIVPPTDCILANDGKIILTSADFLVNQEYEISLRNKLGWAEYVVKSKVNEKNQLILENLPTGDYQLFRLKSPNDNCSVSLKDTTLLLRPPNDQLIIKVENNSPVCEGDTLFLTTALKPGGEILWRGPDRFGSDALDAFIENTGSINEGIYTVTATFGFCTQKKEIFVTVKPKVEITIEGREKYCVRDTIKLTYQSKNIDLNHQWYGPSGSLGNSDQFSAAVMSLTQSGMYTLIAGNGACSDTSSIQISILETPSLTLKDTITADFCDPIIFSPIISESNSLDYRWKPDDGLSCNNCPNPQLIPVINTRYYLNVINDFGCSDSASVSILLDKSNVVFAPNIFSTTGSGANAQFALQPNCVVRYIHSLAIFDRYGNEVFTANALNPDQKLESWDGKMNGVDVSQGVYIWVAKIELVDGTIVTQSGNITKI
jgi:uncharacterized repeat protein (TIGR01451 family)